MWANLATQSAKGSEFADAVKLRDSIEAGLTAAQVAESKRMGAEWSARLPAKANR
jgi:hypothetical protein